MSFSILAPLIASLILAQGSPVSSESQGQASEPPLVIPPPQPRIKPCTSLKCPREPATRNIRSWAARIQDNYPKWSALLKEEGTTGVTVTVSPTGDVIQCVVTLSSGFERLDEAACDGMTRFARFNAAVDGEGNPVEGTYSTRITYRLDTPEYLKQLPKVVPIDEEKMARRLDEKFTQFAAEYGWSGKVSYSIAVTIFGKATRCEITSSSGVREVDFEACRLVRDLAEFEPQKIKPPFRIDVGQYSGTITVSAAD